MPRPGFLGTSASFEADLVLVLEACMGIGLVAGAFLARRRRYRAHAWVQSTIVLVNLALVVVTMVPSLRVQILPAAPAKWVRPHYLVAIAHGTLGALVQSAGLYVLLSAGTSLLPPSLRLTRYKPWMRALLVSWWIVLLLGLATYLRWY